MRSILLHFSIFLLLIGCQDAATPTPPPSTIAPTEPAATVAPTDLPAATDTVVPTDTPPPTDTPVPTNTATSVPTATPIPTDTPTPTNTPLPTPTADLNAAIIDVTDEIVLSDVKRLGLNIGQFNTNAAGFLMKNVMPNPGFESAEFHLIFIADDSATTERAPARADFWNTDWNNEEFFIGHHEGFWNGAEYEVLTGAAAGQRGTVSDFTHENNRLVWYLDGESTPVGGAAIMVRQALPGFISDRYDTVIGEPNDVRPDSPGEQSARLTPRDDGLPSFTRFLDQFTLNENPEAGKLLQLNGEWDFSIWAKADGGTSMRIRVAREDGPNFLEETVEVGAEWQLIELNFTGDDPQIEGVPGRLRVDLWPNEGQVLVDDVTLMRSEYDAPTRFSDRVIETVQAYQPGIVRFWASNLSHSLDNVLSAEFAHKPTGFSPRRTVGLFFTYSLHEFLMLAELVDAEPWYVIPPTFTEEEAQNLVAYLAAPADAHPYAALRAEMGQEAPWIDVFPTIHLEWGNEIWGGANGADPFLGATLGGGQRAAELANRRFAAMREVEFFQPDKFSLIIGGQYRAPTRQTEIEANSDNHDAIAIAPYYGVLEQYATDAERYLPLYAHANEAGNGLLSQSMTRLDPDTAPAIYEINLHMVENDIPNDIRNDVLSSQGAAISLPLTMLHYMRDLGIRDQAVWELVEFSTRNFRSNNWARLFGVMRDLEATYRPRPTYIALQMANEVIGGDMMRVDVQTETYSVPAINRVLQPINVPYVEAFAFQEGGQTGIILFNTDIANARQAVVNLPVSGVATGWVLSAENINDDNEDELQVERQPLQFADFGTQSRLTLPPHSMIVLSVTP